ncbi:MAG: T9SS type A sorting domain-containing protein [Ignavibacteria bacterium]|nr:T9SS type A sorting domain-containing protein [Ignavibacteria bacterium]
MRKFILLSILMGSILYSQNAQQYLPIEVGNVWVNNVYLLDSLGNPVGEPQVIIDSSVAYQNFLGRQTLFIVSRPAGVEIGDTNWVSASTQSIFIHQRDLEIDTLITFKLPDWFEYYRFGTSLGTFYQIYRFDTTLTVPQLGTLPLRFLMRGARLGLDTVTVPAGFFNAVKFRTEIKVQYLVALPPPLPPIGIDIVTIPFNDWLAQGRYIIKSIQEPFSIDTLNLFIPGSMRELVEFKTPTLVENENKIIENFELYQNYPNPFNGSTIIQFNLKRNEKVNLKIFDILGREITTFIDGELKSGLHQAYFEAGEFNLSSGIYYYKLKTDSGIKVKAMVYAK